MRVGRGTSGPTVQPRGLQVLERLCIEKQEATFILPLDHHLLQCKHGAVRDQYRACTFLSTTLSSWHCRPENSQAYS